MGPRDWTPPPGSQQWEQAAKTSTGRQHKLNRVVGLWIPLLALAVLTVVLLAGS